MRTLVNPLSVETSHTTRVLFHSFLLGMKCRLQSVTCHTIRFSGMTSLTRKSTKVSPNRTVKLSPGFWEAPVNPLVHQYGTRLILPIASWTVIFAEIVAVYSFVVI